MGSWLSLVLICRRCICDVAAGTACDTSRTNENMRRRQLEPSQSSTPPPREIKKPTPASRLAGTPGQYFQSPEAGHVATQTMQTADCAVGLATSCR